MPDTFVPIETLAPARRWQFAEPIRVHTLGGGHSLLLHPPSGSWMIVDAGGLNSFVALAAAAKRGILDQMARDGEIAEDHPLLVELQRGGLLVKEGRAAWSDVTLNHAATPLNMLILKLVGYCNLACKYCYDYNQATFRQRMPSAIAESAIGQALARAVGGLTILFHGGEPLLEFDLIRRLVAFARREASLAGREVVFGIQTNGTQFTREIVDFLLAEDFAVGVSLDGPAEVNDSLRVDHSGRGQQARIEGALRDYPELTSRLGILTTVTSRNVDNLVGVARYVRELGVPRWDTTLFEATGRGAHDPERFKPDTNRLIASHFRLMDAIEQGEFDQMEVRPVLKYLRNALSYRRSSMCLRNGCGAAADLVSIRVDGTIEACDCIKDPHLELGSLKRVGIDDALASAAAHAVRTRATDTLPTCRTCDWRILCGGTCLAKASLNTVDEQQCRLAMALFPEIFRRLAKSDRLQRYARLFP
jgi:uncharacterized protein